MKILKYEVPSRNEWFDLDIHPNSVILTMQSQHVKEWMPGVGGGVYDRLVLWAIPRPSIIEPDRKLELITIGTGIEMDGLFKGHEKYIATAQEGPFVWHLFRR